MDLKTKLSDIADFTTCRQVCIWSMALLLTTALCKTKVSAIQTDSRQVSSVVCIKAPVYLKQKLKLLCSHRQNGRIGTDQTPHIGLLSPQCVWYTQPI